MQQFTPLFIPLLAANDSGEIRLIRNQRLTRHLKENINVYSLSSAILRATGAEQGRSLLRTGVDLS